MFLGFDDHEWYISLISKYFYQFSNDSPKDFWGGGTIDLSFFDTSSVTDMSNMFFNCGSLTSLDLSNFNTGGVTGIQGMSGMFKNCYSLTSLNLSGWNTGGVKNMNSMFAGCSSLTSLDLSNFNTGVVTDMSEMFDNCNSLTSLDLSSFSTSKVGNMNGMFHACSSLQTLKLGPDFVISPINSTSMFLDCTKLYKIVIGKDRNGFATQLISVLKSSGLNKGWLYNLEGGYISIDPYTNKNNYITLDKDYYTYDEQTGLATILIEDIIRDGTLKYCSNSFSGLKDLKQVTNITSLDTRYVETMAGMFNGCTNLRLPLD